MQSRGKQPTGSPLRSAVGAIHTSPSPPRLAGVGAGVGAGVDATMGMTWAATTAPTTGEDEDDDGAAAVQAAADALAAELSNGPNGPNGPSDPLDASMNDLEQSINEREGRVQGN